MRYIFACLAWVCLVPYTLLAQPKQGQARLDSLLAEVPRMRPDTVGVNLLYELSHAYQTVDAEQGIAYGQKSLALAEKLGWSKGIAKAYYKVGANYRMKGDMPTALAYYGKTLTLARQSGNLILLGKVENALGNALTNPDSALAHIKRSLSVAERAGDKGTIALNEDYLARYYLAKNDLPKALAHGFKALDIQQECGDMYRMAWAELLIGNVYMREKAYPKALDYYLKTLKHGRTAGDLALELNALNQVGSTYHMRSLWTASHEFGQAMAYYKQAVALAEKSHQDYYLSTALKGIASVLEDEAIRERDLNTKAGLPYRLKSLQIDERLGDSSRIAADYEGLGSVYFYAADDSLYNAEKNPLLPATRTACWTKTIEYYEKCTQYHRRTHNLRALMWPARFLATAYARVGKYEKAFTATWEYHDASDSIYSVEKSEKIAEVETQRELEIRDKDIQIASLEVAKRTNQRYFLYAGIGALTLVLGLLFRGFRRQKSSNVLLTKEKKRSDDLLLNILPEEVAEELKNSGGAEARQFDEVSVLFTDFVNFTETAEHLSPHDLVKELHASFSAFDGIIEQHGLEKIKTIGDAYMAVSGLPVTDPLHAQKCVAAALEIRDLVAARSRQGAPFQIRIGIHSGPVVAGIVGIKKFAYDIWGDTVNTAARMEQHGEAGQVNISQATYELVKDDFACRERGKITAKHKGDIEMYFIEEKTVAQPPA